jgi:hypothetical protein
LRDAVALLNRLPEGVTMPESALNSVAADGSAVSLDAQTRAASSVRPDFGAPETEGEDVVAVKAAPKAKPAPSGAFKLINLEEIAMDAGAPIYRLSMRVWLAPFDMGVSQDVDILLMPSDEPGLYELQLRLMRLSGEISAWRRVNRQFMSDLRKQLLLWRTIRPEGQQEYILRGRAHVAGEAIPAETPGALVA